MTEKQNDQKSGSGSQHHRVLLSNEMFRIIRTTHYADDGSQDHVLEPGIPFREILAIRLEFLDNFFSDQGFPRLGQRIFVDSDDWLAWEPRPDTMDAAEIRADELDGPPHSGETQQIAEQTGLDFIFERIEYWEANAPGAYWLIAEAKLLSDILDSEDHDNALRLAHALGEVHEKADAHDRFLHSVTVGRKQARKARAAAPTGGQGTKAKAEAWKAEAWSAASEYWLRKPNAPNTEVARHVCKSLVSRNALSARGCAPTETTVRKFLGLAKKAT